MPQEQPSPEAKADDHKYLGYRSDDGTPTAPTPDQETAEQLFWEEDVDGLLLYGGQNSGKTLGAAKIGVVETMLKYPGIHIGIGHVSYRTLEESLIDKLKVLLDRQVLLSNGKWHKMFQYQSHKHKITIRIPDERYLNKPLSDGGYTARIDCLALDPRKGLDELLNIQGSQYGAFIWDQAEAMHDGGRRVWQAIVSRTRRAPHKVIMTANPEVDAWFEDIFLKPDSPDYDRLRSVIMNPSGNRFKDAGYMDRMKRTLPPADWDRFIEGKAVTVRGRILRYNWEFGFHEWRRVPDDYDIWGILDFGQRDPSVYQLWAVSPTGHCFLFASVKIMGADAEIKTVSTAIKELTHHWLHKGRDLHERLPNFRGIHCDPSMAARKESSSRKSQIQLFREEGVILKPAPIIGRNKEGQIKTEILILQNLHQSGRLHICFTQEDWKKEELNWSWAKSGKDEPGDWRKLAADGQTVIHHFDHLACTRYFGATYKTNLGDGDVDILGEPSSIMSLDRDDRWREVGQVHSDDDRNYFSKLLYSR